MDKTNEAIHSNLYEILMKEIKIQEKEHKIYMNKDYKETAIELILMNVVEELQSHDIRLSDKNIARELSLIVKSLLNQQVLGNRYDYTAFKYLAIDLLLDSLEENNLFIMALALSNIITENCDYNEIKSTIVEAKEKRIAQQEELEAFSQKLVTMIVK